MKILKRKITTFLIILLVVATVGASVAIPAILNSEDPPSSSANNFGEYEGDSLGNGLYASHPLVHTFNNTDNFFTELVNFNISSYPTFKYTTSFDGENRYGHITHSKYNNYGPSMYKTIISNKDLELLPIPEELISDYAVATYNHIVIEFDMRIDEAGFVDDSNPYFLKVSYGSEPGALNDYDSLRFYKTSSDTYEIKDYSSNRIVKSNLRFDGWYNYRIELFSYNEDVAEGSTAGALYINNEYICDLNHVDAFLSDLTFSIVPRIHCDNLVVDIDNLFAGFN